MLGTQGLRFVDFERNSLLLHLVDVASQLGSFLLMREKARKGNKPTLVHSRPIHCAGPLDLDD
jgi:hypothetical protein